MPLANGPYQEPDWIDRPVWTSEALAEAKRSAQERIDARHGWTVRRDSRGDLISERIRPYGYLD